MYSSEKKKALFKKYYFCQVNMSIAVFPLFFIHNSRVSVNSDVWTSKYINEKIHLNKDSGSMEANGALMYFN